MKTARDFMLEIPVLNCHDGDNKSTADLTR